MPQRSQSLTYTWTTRNGLIQRRYTRHLPMTRWFSSPARPRLASERQLRWARRIVQQYEEPEAKKSAGTCIVSVDLGGGVGDWPWCADELGSRSRHRGQSRSRRPRRLNPTTRDTNLVHLFSFKCTAKLPNVRCLSVCLSVCLSATFQFISLQPSKPKRISPPPFFPFFTNVFFLSRCAHGTPHHLLLCWCVHEPMVLCRAHV